MYVSKKIELTCKEGRIWLCITEAGESKLIGPVYLHDARRMVSVAHSLAKADDEVLIDDTIIERSLVWSDF
jgi:hypothetical protein